MSPWDAMDLSQLSNNLQIIEANDRYFRDLTPQNSPREQKSSPAKSVPEHNNNYVPNHNQSTEKVVKPQPSRGKNNDSKVNADFDDDDDIYDYYEGFGPSKKKRRGVVQNCKEAASTSTFGRKDGNDDDGDEKPLKERSLKSILDDVKVM